MFRLAFALLLTFTAAQAAEVVDQSQTAIDLSDQWSVGAAAREKYAQTFTAGVTGNLTALRLPVFGCSGEVLIEVRNVGSDGKPGPAILQETRTPGSATPATTTTLQEFRLSVPVAITSGQSYSFTIQMADDAGVSFCRMLKTLPGELYAAGDAFLKKPANGPDWLALSSIGVAPFYDDIAFETIVDTGGGSGASSGDCLIPGFGGAPPIPSNAPVCRCLRDAGLREFRCALLHPDFFAIRRIPWPIALDRPYTETWEVLPLTKLKGPVGLRLEGANVPKPVNLTFMPKGPKIFSTRAIQMRAPAQAIDGKGVATISYGGESFGIDTSLPAAQYIPGKKP